MTSETVRLGKEAINMPGGGGGGGDCGGGDG